MIIITHITVGSDYFIPTEAQLNTIKDDFINSDVFVHTCAHVNCIELNASDKLIIEAGGAEWTPTQTELDKLKADFKQIKYTGGVIATRSGVWVSTL